MNSLLVYGSDSDSDDIDRGLSPKQRLQDEEGASSKQLQDGGASKQLQGDDHCKEDEDNDDDDDEVEPTPATSTSLTPAAMAAAAQAAAASGLGVGSLLPKSKAQLEKEQKEREKKEKKKKKKQEKQAKKEQKEREKREEQARLAEEAKTVEGAAKQQVARMKGVMMRKINCAPTLATKKGANHADEDSKSDDDEAKTEPAAAAALSSSTPAAAGALAAGAAPAAEQQAAAKPSDSRRRGHHVGIKEAMGSFSLSVAAPDDDEEEKQEQEAALTAPQGPSPFAVPAVIYTASGRVAPNPMFVRGYSNASLDEIKAFEQQPKFQPELDAEEEDVIPDALMGRKESKKGMVILDINGADLRKKTPEEEIRAMIEAQNPTNLDEVNVQAAFWNSKVGGEVITKTVCKTSKRKHQINQLAHDAGVMELELAKKRALGTAKRTMARGKYGW